MIVCRVVVVVGCSSGNSWHHLQTCSVHMLQCELGTRQRQHSAPHCKSVVCVVNELGTRQPHHTAPHWTTLQHTAIYCSTLHHTATHYSILQLTATHWNSLWLTWLTGNQSTLSLIGFQCVTVTLKLPLSDLIDWYTATHCSILQHAATHWNSTRGNL